MLRWAVTEAQPRDSTEISSLAFPHKTQVAAFPIKFPFPWLYDLVTKWLRACVRPCWEADFLAFHP
jgi:hypothetical protein